jgi:hypothetical protein
VTAGKRLLWLVPVFLSGLLCSQMARGTELESGIYEELMLRLGVS